MTLPLSECRAAVVSTDAFIAPPTIRAFIGFRRSYFWEELFFSRLRDDSLIIEFIFQRLGRQLVITNSALR